MKHHQFAIILTNLNDQEDAKLVAGKIMQEFYQPFPITGSEDLNLNIGIALFPGDGSDSNALLRNAETALSEAKILGENFYSFYSSTLHHHPK